MPSLIIGASAGLGKAIAESLAKAGDDLFLVASDKRDLEAISSDLKLRYSVRVYWEQVDLASPDATGLRTHVFDAFKTIDNLFYVAGLSFMDSGAIPGSLLKRIIAVNFDSAVLLINTFLNDMVGQKGANIITVSSVAAARGRRLNSIYGAAKRGLEAYSESLRHWLVGSECRVQCYRVGYLKTRMTFGQKLLFPAADPARAAQVIVKNLGKDIGLVYLPWWWRPIIMLVCLLPWPIFKRLNI